MKETILYCNRCLKYYDGFKQKLFLYNVLKIIIAFLDLSEPYYYSLVIANLINMTISGVRKNLFVIIVIYILKLIFETLLSLLETHIMRSIAKNAKIKIFDYLTKLLPSELYKISDGKQISLLSNDTGSLYTYINILSTYFTKLMSMLVSGIVLISMSPILAFITILIYPVIYIINNKFSKIIKAKGIEVYVMYDSLISKIKLLTNNLITLSTNPHSTYVKNTFSKDVGIFKDTVIANDKLKLLFRNIYNSLNFFGYLLFMVVGASFVTSAKMAVSEFISFSSYSKKFNSNLYSFSTFKTQIQDEIIKIERIFELEDTYFSQIDNDKEKYILDTLITDIILQDICFEINNEIIVKNLNIEFILNNHYAITGANGQGKTTILNLLAGIYLPSKGKIYFNGVDMQTIKTESIRNNVSFLEQYPKVFNMTIWENLTIFNADATPEEVNILCEQLDIYKDILSMPSQFNTIIDKNFNLSGGQVQKIAIIRCLLSKNKILLMDEPSASLDSDSKKLFYEMIKNNLSNTMVIVVTHDLEYLKYFDLVYSV